MSIVTSLNVEEFSQRRTLIKYPNVLIKNVNPTSPLVISLLEAGDIPVIGELHGERRVIAYMSDSAFNIDRLIRTHGKLVYSISDNEQVEVNNIRDYLEVFIWT